MTEKDHQFFFSTVIYLVAFIVVGCPPVVNGQSLQGAVGVSLKLHGVTIPNNSLVDFDDILYTGPQGFPAPTNANGRHDQTLVCVTDLVDCCESQQLGNWYHPDGGIVTTNPGTRIFRSNRGQNEIRNGRQFYGSVRIFRSYSPLSRGRFRCELPSAADSNVNQVLYANIVNFGADFRVPPVTISPSGSGTSGETYSLMCSTTLHSDSTPLPSDIPSPTFEWFFGPNNSSLPSHVTPQGTAFENGNTYTSTLQFSPLSQSHAGKYTCRLGAGRLANSVMVTVTAPAISVQITPTGAPVLGQNGYSLTCSVDGAGNLNSSITYQWTKNNGTGTQVQVGVDPAVLSFSPLRLSDAGHYTCQATVSSPYLNDDITLINSHNIMSLFTSLVPVLTPVISSNIPNPIHPIGSAVTLTCSVELSPVMDVSVTVTTVWTGPAGFMTTNTAQPIMGSTTTYISTAVVSSFGREQSGVYICRATLISYALINRTIGVDVSGMQRITVGVYLFLKGTVYANNSAVSITEIGVTNTDQNEGLQCITDRLPCCATARVGQWYFPDAMQVPTLGAGASRATTFYRNRGDSGGVNLNRVSTDVTMPTGLFCCVVPDATGDLQTVCANIVSYSVEITPNGTLTGTPTAGEDFSLDCSISGTSDPVTYQWFASNGTQLTNISQLQFSPLRASDAGLYTCQATVGGVEVEGSATVTVSLPAPIAVIVSPPMGIIIIGSSPNLTCTVELSPAVDVPVTVTTEWSGSAGVTITPTSPVMESLTRYTIAAMVDAARGGNYTCQATLSSPSQFITDGGVTSGSTFITVVPIPTMILHSDSPSPILSGSSPTLTCTVEMSPVVSVPLNVTTAWKGPDGTTIISSTNTEMISFTLYTSSSILTSVELAHSGEYTCTMNFENRFEMSARTNFAVVDGVFQLRLKSVGICQQWYDEDSEQYSNFIKGALAKAIERHCKCHFPITNLLNEDVFICEDSPNLMTYRNTLLGTHNFNGTQIIGFIQDWVTSGPLIKIRGSYVRVDSSCPVAISSLDEPECGQEKQDCLCDNDPQYAMCAEHLKDENISNCFKGCIIRNG